MVHDEEVANLLGQMRDRLFHLGWDRVLFGNGLVNVVSFVVGPTVFGVMIVGGRDRKQFYSIHSIAYRLGSFNRSLLMLEELVLQELIFKLF